MFVALVRAIVLSGLGVSLRTSSYAMPIPLITITVLLQTTKRKNSGMESLKKWVRLSRRTEM